MALTRIVRSGNQVDYFVEREDGGLNTKGSPSGIAPNESPDCKNVVLDDEGSVETRPGSNTLNTQAVGSFAIDGGISYNGSMVVAAGGHLFRLSGTTFATIPSAQSQFVAGNKVAFAQYQGLLMMSDGTNGPYKYAASDRFHQLGIAVPSAPSGDSGSAAGNIAADTYYYKVAYQNTQVVNGEPGSNVAVTLAASGVVSLTCVPTGAASHGVNKRIIYRATSTAGTFKKVGEIADNTTKTFTDTTAVGSETTNAETDATAPTPWSTVVVHLDRLFFDDNADKSLQRHTEYTNPFVSKALSFKRINTNSSLTEIRRIAVQDDLVTALMDDDETWVTSIVDPSDDSSFTQAKARINAGITGVLAGTAIDNGFVFVSKRNGKIIGLQILSGLRAFETADDKLRTDTITEKIEPNILALPSGGWTDIAIFEFGNRLYIALREGLSTNNENIYYFDLNRLGSKGQPGSWVPWDGIPVSCFWEHNGGLYAGSSAADGKVFELDQASQYNDSGSAIDSYYWTKEDGGGPSLDHFTKDFKELPLWYQRLGAWFMNIKYRLDGDKGSGTSIPLNLDPGGSLWGTMVWGEDWGGATEDDETNIDLATAQGRRIQIGFDNQNTVDQGFKVHRHGLIMNLRSKR